MFPTPKPEDTLTPRELDVIRFVADGLANADIGRELNISTGYVKHVVLSVCNKLGAENRVMVARWYWMKHGFSECTAPSPEAVFAVDSVSQSNC